MRKSRTETAETRARILSTASKMFMDRGLGAVGMREVMAGASLAPGGFYRHFSSKDGLIAEASSAALDRSFAMLERETAGKSQAQAVERIVSVYLGQSQVAGKPYLCPLAMLGAELRHADAHVRETAINGYQRIVELIASRLENRTRRSALVAAGGIVSMLVGAVTLAEIAPEPAIGHAILSNAKALIREVVGRP